MKTYTDLELLSLSKGKRFVYKLKCFFCAIPGFFKKLGIGIYNAVKKLGIGIYIFFRDIVMTFIEGDYKTKVSYLIMGFGNITRKQVLRGILFLVMEVVFIWYMIAMGGYYVGKLNTLGTVQPQHLDDGTIIYGDNSFKILLYGVLTIFFIVAFIYTWYLNIKQNRINEQILKEEKQLTSSKDDLRALVDKNFHKTLLTLPTLGIIIFTVLPIFFMILVAFTNYDANHNGVSNALFGWQGFTNFSQIFSWNSGANSFSATFGEVLLWTLIWAFFATFTNYFLGMMVAMLINKKGIKLKKVWRTVLVMSIAIPQFISLLYVSKMFDYHGIINDVIVKCGGEAIHFLDNDASPWVARITVIIINIWIGIPYLMLVTTGILMNIPADLYESANIDGATKWQQYTKITLPYMLFVTGPYLLTSFTGNMNNFNVIYLLTGGAPHPQTMANNAGQTDLLITWLFNLAIKDSNYALGAVIGIMVFVVVALISVVVYNIIPSTKNEEEFQ
ncbi:MAG: sugar ABC transporter permease [Firmicutes bacterium]|nr:sugar ABC transporter permease [Candidatus Fiminaster equi]